MGIINSIPIRSVMLISNLFLIILHPIFIAQYVDVLSILYTILGLIIKKCRDWIKISLMSVHEKNFTYESSWKISLIHSIENDKVILQSLKSDRCFIL